MGGLNLHTSPQIGDLSIRFPYPQIGDLSILNRKVCSIRQIGVQSNFLSYPQMGDCLSQYIFALCPNRRPLQCLSYPQKGDLPKSRPFNTFCNIHKSTLFQKVCPIPKWGGLNMHISPQIGDLSMGFAVSPNRRFSVSSP